MPIGKDGDIPGSTESREVHLPLQGRLSLALVMRKKMDVGKVTGRYRSTERHAHGWIGLCRGISDASCKHFV